MGGLGIRRQLSGLAPCRPVARMLTTCLTRSGGHLCLAAGIPDSNGTRQPRGKWGSFWIAAAELKARSASNGSVQPSDRRNHLVRWQVPLRVEPSRSATRAGGSGSGRRYDAICLPALSGRPGLGASRRICIFPCKGLIWVGPPRSGMRAGRSGIGAHPPLLRRSSDVADFPKPVLRL